MDKHIFFHLDFGAAERQKFESTMLAHLTAIQARLDQIMPSIADITAKLTTLEASVAAETAVDRSVVTLLTGLTSTLADLKKQLADAIASNDPVGLQAVVDRLGAVQSTVTTNTAGLAAAVTANTPSA